MVSLGATSECITSRSLSRHSRNAVNRQDTIGLGKPSLRPGFLCFVRSDVRHKTAPDKRSMFFGINCIFRRKHLPPRRSESEPVAHRVSLRGSLARLTVMEWYLPGITHPAACVLASLKGKGEGAPARWRLAGQ